MSIKHPNTNNIVSGFARVPLSLPASDVGRCSAKPRRHVIGGADGMPSNAPTGRGCQTRWGTREALKELPSNAALESTIVDSLAAA